MIARRTLAFVSLFFGAFAAAAQAQAQGVTLPIGPNGMGGSGGGGSGLTSVGLSFTGGLISVANSPLVANGTLALSIAGTSGGIPYFASSGTWASSAALASGSLIIGGGAGGAPSTITLGGDCTFSTPNITCTETNGVAFGTLATQNSVTAAQLPNPTATTLGGVQSAVNVSNQFVTGISTSGVVQQAQPQFSNLNGSATPSQLPNYQIPGILSGHYYNLAPSGQSNTGAAATQSVIKCRLGYVANTDTYTAAAIRIPATAGSTNVQIAIYSVSGGLPATLLASTGNIPDNATGNFSATFGTSVSLGPAGTGNTPWVYYCSNANDSTVVMQAINTVDVLFSNTVGSATLGDVLTSPVQAISCTGAACNGGSSTFGTWPSSLAGSTWTDVTNGSMPMVVILGQ